MVVLVFMFYHDTLCLCIKYYTLCVRYYLWMFKIHNKPGDTSQMHSIWLISMGFIVQTLEQK
jgi:hypothetical protein